jgi:hypothetical protein
MFCVGYFFGHQAGVYRKQGDTGGEMVVCALWTPFRMPLIEFFDITWPTELVRAPVCNSIGDRSLSIMNAELCCFGVSWLKWGRAKFRVFATRKFLKYPEYLSPQIPHFHMTFKPPTNVGQLQTNRNNYRQNTIQWMFTFRHKFFD